jgi:hypothetical protein
MAGKCLYQEYWEVLLAFDSEISRLPPIFIEYMVCWTGDCPAGSNYCAYPPGVLCPANTAVPNGLGFRDLPASFVAKGVYGD